MVLFQLLTGRVRAADLEASNRTLEGENRALLEAKDRVYRERDMLVAALSKIFPSHLERHPESDTTWEDDWRWIVFIDLPAGQASWHIHDSELPLFEHLTRLGGNSWDGHSVEEKYARVLALPKGYVRAAAPAMDLETARGINGECVRWWMVQEGLEETATAPDLSGHSLERMIEAARVVSTHNDAEWNRTEKGGRKIEVVCDDRLLAAIFVMHHYDPLPLRSLEPVRPVLSAGRLKLCLIMMPEGKKEDEER